MPSRPLEPGDPVRLGRFELLGRLGEGGQGVVYLGRGTNPGEERVAVKVLRSTVDADVLVRLARELDAIHQVQPFVTAGVIEASAEGDRRYIVSEFIDGPSLQERVDDRGPLSEGDLQRLAVGTATALTAIHGAGVVHRDFKPANVLLGPDGPRVVDFGIARLTDAATITSGLIGTPSYVAPEQLAGRRPTSAVDIFAWALTMIYAATGRLAFGADSVPAVMHRIMYEEPDVSGLPPSLRTIVLECLDKDPDRRPSARDLLLRLVDPSAPRAPAGVPAHGGAGGPMAPADGLADSVPHTGPQYPPAGPTFPGGQPAGISGPGRVAARSRRTVSLRPASKTIRPNPASTASEISPWPRLPPSQLTASMTRPRTSENAGRNHLDRVMPRLQSLVIEHLLDCDAEVPGESESQRERGGVALVLDRVDGLARHPHRRRQLALGQVLPHPQRAHLVLHPRGRLTRPGCGAGAGSDGRNRARPAMRYSHRFQDFTAGPLLSSMLVIDKLT